MCCSCKEGLYEPADTLDTCRVCSLFLFCLFRFCLKEHAAHRCKCSLSLGASSLFFHYKIQLWAAYIFCAHQNCREARGINFRWCLCPSRLSHSGISFFAWAWWLWNFFNASVCKSALKLPLSGWRLFTSHSNDSLAISVHGVTVVQYCVSRYKHLPSLFERPSVPKESSSDISPILRMSVCSLTAAFHPSKHAKPGGAHCEVSHWIPGLPSQLSRAMVAIYTRLWLAVLFSCSVLGAPLLQEDHCRNHYQVSDVISLWTTLLLRSS